MNFHLKPNILTGYIKYSISCVKQIKNVCNYSSCINIDVSSDKIYKIRGRSSWQQLRRNRLYQFDLNRNFCAKTIPKDANVFGDLSNEKYEKFEMDEAEREEEEATENDASIPRRQKLSAGQYCNIIKSHLQNKNLDLALNVLDLVAANRDKPILYMYTLLIYGHAQQGDLKKCWKLYNRLKKHGFEPNGAIYNSLLNACAISKNTRRALEYLQKFREIFVTKNIVLNEAHYATLIKAYGWHNQMETAFEIADEAVDKKMFTPTIYAVLFHAVISNKSSGLKYALVLWHHMKKNKITPTIIHYNLLFRAIRDTKFGELTINESLIPNVPVSQITCLETGRPDLLSSPPVLSCTLLDVIKNQPKNKKSKSLVKIDMEEALNNPAVTIIENLDIILEQNPLILFGGIEGMLQRMKDNNIIPDVKTVTMLLELLPRSVDAEDAYLKYVQEENIKVDISFFNTLIVRRNRRYKLKEAYRVLNEIQRYRLMPNIMTFGALAIGCQNLHQGAELLGQLNNFGFVPNLKVLGVMLYNACHGRNFKYIEYLLDYMIKFHIKPDQYMKDSLENFEKLLLKELRTENRYNRKEIQQLRLEYNSYKVAYNDWLQKIQEDEFLFKCRKSERSTVASKH